MVLSAYLWQFPVSRNLGPAGFGLRVIRHRWQARIQAGCSNWSDGLMRITLVLIRTHDPVEIRHLAVPNLVDVPPVWLVLQTALPRRRGDCAFLAPLLHELEPLED